jgi:cell division transport system permease protein
MIKTSKVIDTTKKNVKRNRWLSFATIFVSTIVLAITSFFVSVAILGRVAVKYYEQRAQVIIFFKQETPEADTLSLRDKIYDPTLIANIQYISQEDALAIYKEDFADNPDLISTLTADSLPPSLEIRAYDIDGLLQVISNVNTEKETNPNIDEIMYFKDVVDNLKTLSRIINIGAVVLISGLLIISFFLIRITIGFNINAHKEEIQIMNLVGSTDSFIKTPFILEGAFYGLVGGLLAATIIIVPWYTVVLYTQGTGFATWLNQMLADFNLSFLKTFNIAFVLIYYLIHLVFGAILGVVSSFSAVKRYLKQQ